MNLHEARLSAARRDLDYMRTRYGKSRPAAKTLLDEFDSILDDAETEISKIISEKEHDIEMRYQGRLEQAESREEAAWAKVNHQAGQINDLRDTLAGKRALKEERARDGEMVRVAFDRPSGFDWTLADIEEMAYRMRLGGADDETVVNTASHEVSTWVPDPNMVRLGLKVQGEDEPEKRKSFAWWPRARMAFYFFGGPTFILGALAVAASR